MRQAAGAPPTWPVPLARGRAATIFSLDRGSA